MVSLRRHFVPNPVQVNYCNRRLAKRRRPLFIHTRYDADGNMTTVPQPGNETVGLTCTYDAWNRLVEVESGSTVLATYSYDGLNRRITETAGGHTTGYYYDSSDQVLEERVDGATSANVQYVWGLRNVDDLVLRDRNNGSGGSLGKTGSGLGERLYALQDANWNVVALVDPSGAVQERFTYTAYGTATALNPNFSSPYSGTNFHWTTLFAARDVDTATGLYYNNARWYNPGLGEFTTTDPAAADPNTYRYAGNNPVTTTDPTGEQVAQNYVWDPEAGDSRDTFSGMTYTEIQAMEAANLEAQMASPAGIKAAALASWLNDPRNHVDGVPTFWDYYTARLNPFNAPPSHDAGDTACKIGQDTGLVMTAVSATALAGIGAAAAWAGLAGGGATTVAATGTALVGAAETPEGQALITDLEEDIAPLEEGGAQLLSGLYDRIYG